MARTPPLAAMLYAVGVTAADFSRTIGFSQTGVSAVLTGARTPSRRFRRSACMALGVSERELFAPQGDDEPCEPNPHPTGDWRRMPSEARTPLIRMYTTKELTGIRTHYNRSRDLP